MIDTILYGYVAGWTVTSIVLVLTTHKLHGRAGVAVAAGPVWPLVILGGAQIAIVAFVAELTRRTIIRQTSTSEQEIDELVEMLLDTAEAGAHC